MVYDAGRGADLAGDKLSAYAVHSKGINILSANCSVKWYRREDAQTFGLNAVVPPFDYRKVIFEPILHGLSIIMLSIAFGLLFDLAGQGMAKVWRRCRRIT